MQQEDMRRVLPISPVAPYIGGKKQLSSRLVRLIESVPHTTYAEPFMGMGGVFLRRESIPKAEIINDLSADVSTFFRVLQRFYVPFMDMLRFRFTSRREFEQLLATDPSTLLDLERAVRFLYLQRLAFGGKVAGRNFGVAPERSGRFDVVRLEPLLTALNDCLSGVIIENLPYFEFIARYDAPGVLFYLDPPYFGCESDYGKGMFSRNDFERLARQLGSIKGMFILSLNDAPQVRAVFCDFDIETVDLTYTIGSDGPKDVKEVIITSKNLPIKAPVASLFDPQNGT